MYPEAFKNLIASFKKLPSIGEKTAERLVFSVMNMSVEEIDLFSDSIINIKKIKKCKECGHLTENEICNICLNPERKNDVLCVVESPKNVILFEKTESFFGKYHVLDGLISPLDGITPDDINLKKLISRVKEEKIKEIIVAVKPSVDGEITALYISKLFENSDVLVTKIAHGIPIGTDMEYIDSLTLEAALEDRKKV